MKQSVFQYKFYGFVNNFGRTQNLSKFKMQIRLPSILHNAVFFFVIFQSVRYTLKYPSKLSNLHFYTGYILCMRENDKKSVKNVPKKLCCTTFYSYSSQQSGKINLICSIFMVQFFIFHS